MRADPLLAALAPRIALAVRRTAYTRAAPVLNTAPVDAKADLARDVQAARNAFPNALLLTRVGGFMEVRRAAPAALTA